MMSTNKNLYSEETIIDDSSWENCLVWGFIHIDFLFLIKYSLEQESQTFSVKGPIVTVLGLMRHVVFILTTHLCSCSKKAAINEWTWLGSNKTILMDPDI